MSKENDQEKQNTSKSKYILGIAVIVLIASYFACLNNTEKTTTAVPTTAKVHNIEEQTTARIDISTNLAEDEKPQFLIFVDGAEKPQKRAFWMYRKGLYGSTVQKEGKELNIVIKALKDANIKLLLSGAQQVDEKKKNIPAWVKYTAFTIDDNAVLDEAKPVWFEEPFTYTIKAKEGEEYKIHTEWQKDNK